MLFIVTIGEGSGFVSAASIEQAERYVREWLGGIGVAEGVVAMPERGGTVLSVADTRLMIRPLPPLCDIRDLAGTPLPAHLDRPKKQSRSNRFAEYLEML